MKDYIAVGIIPDDPYFYANCEQFRVIEEATGNCCGELFDSLSAAIKYMERLQENAEQDAENAAHVARLCEYADVQAWIDRQADQGRPVAWFAQTKFLSF